ncbi:MULTISPECIES: sulfatase-like hydrolase/transferase [unclassified Oceanispirochaeta]|uniref:sulfatase-like hydrolase/transferase n=1 Tax=unclassified Oceanispirochaeta TaxID=2635722 RepID=UPI000E09BA9D|nr:MULTISPECIES: sulfatase-like hydrolase/transferase [unclassified Oceanispirochaeta]MBF9018184.1 sulfatase-like hydrolase/transferase [Oceanispirochaeta sp. M2]NPD74633.1 sulfatase-like hydrolase/transferase [Oceanispirochaeta sp. M1]RDG29503.1 DUF4976 domain-containing protein [Oceanispirochaeta sp. M1]
MNKPNIILLFTDDQHFNTINALGNKEVHTPNMDKLVKEGCSFTHAHIPGGTCGAVCMPSRAMLHTGRSLFHLQKEGQEIPKEHVLMGEHLQKQGYDCFGTGKWHNGSDAYARSFSEGGEIFFGGMWDHWNVPAHSFDPTGKYDSAVPYIKDAFHSREMDVMQSDHISPGKHSTDLFAETTINWLENRESDKPFFLSVAFMAPHDPRTMPQKYMDMFDPEKITLPENFAPEHSFDYGIRDVRDEVLAPYPRTEKEVRQHMAEYYAMIAHLDDAIGDILATLEKKGEMENSIIIFAGDNGLALGQHGLFGKQSAYEHSTRVPLVFKGPGIPSNEQRNDHCYLFDIFPTLIDLLGIERPVSVEGNSLKDSMQKNDRSGHREDMYFAYEDKLRAVKSDEYKLVEYAGSDFRETQLFNLASDPWELNNLVSQNPEKVEEMKEKLYKLRDDWDDLKHPTGRAFWDFYSEN